MSEIKADKIKARRDYDDCRALTEAVCGGMSSRRAVKVWKCHSAAGHAVESEDAHDADKEQRNSMQHSTSGIQAQHQWNAGTAPVQNSSLCQQQCSAFSISGA